MFSLGGKIAWVNLSNNQVKIESTEEYKKFIGSRRVGSYLVFKEVPEAAQPLSSENIITFNTGPLTGTWLQILEELISVQKMWPLTASFLQILVDILLQR